MQRVKWGSFMMRRAGILFSLIFLMFGATAQAADKPLSKAQQELLAVHDAWLAKVNANRQVDGLADFTDDALVLAAEGPIAEGRDAVREYVSMLGKIPGFNVSFALEKVTISSGGNLGYVIGRSAITSLDDSGKRVGGTFRLLTVWRKIAGKWKCYIDTALPQSAEAAGANESTP